MDVEMSGVDIDAEFDLDAGKAALSELGKRLREDDEFSRASSPSRTESISGSAKKLRKKVVIPPSSRARRNATPPIESSQPSTPVHTSASAVAAGQNYLANPGQSVGGQGFAPIQASAALGIFDPPQDATLPSAFRRSSDPNDGEADAIGEDDATFEITPLPVAEELSSIRDDGRPPSPSMQSTAGPTVMVTAGRRGPNRNAQVQRPPVQKTTAGKKGKARVADGEIPNQDFCSSCRGIGKFLCCDGCPRSFHFMCLDPPLNVDELPAEDVWYCKLCRAERDTKPRKPPTSMFAELCDRIDAENPVQFRLPPEIRNFFAGVTTAQNGAYHDSEEVRTKTDRRGFIEERDPVRLRDGRSRPIACYACGGSALPGRKPASEPGATWRSIVSCDYCSLHWHLDCLQPALTSMPPAGKKWMCPNHAEQVMPRRRTVKHNLQVLEINGTGQHNNGNIVVLPDEDAPSSKLDVNEVVINSRKYRVPEKTIRLDFWSKLGFGPRTKNGMIRAPAKATGSESPLTALSGASTPEPEHAQEPTLDDLSAANLVLSFYNSIADKLAPVNEQDTLLAPVSARSSV